MKFLFAGGGTGGHIYPAIAVAKALRGRSADHEILFAGNAAGMESKLVPQEGFRIEYISSAGLSSNPVKAAKAAVKLTAGVFQSLLLLSREKPDMVIGSGGYVSAPVTAAAFLRGVPVVLLEQNTVPGKTNKFVSRIARKVCISFQESEKYVPPGKAVLTGNPVRDEVLSADRAAGRRTLEIPEDMPCLLVTGASQGAKSINDAMLGFLEKWKDRSWAVIHLTGEKHYDTIKSLSAEILEGTRLLYRPFPFLKNISDAYAACDLVICRAGATTLAEVTARGIASVVIPYPHAAENHQEKNGRWLARQGAALLILDGEAAEKLPDAAGELMKDADRREKMAGKSRGIGRPEAVSQILQVLESAASK